MKAYDELYSSYECYLEHMNQFSSLSAAYDFENWLKWQLRINNITKKEFKQCYDKEGYFIEPKLKCDYDPLIFDNN